MKDYKDLRVWQKGIEITDVIYSMTDQFPKTEIYTLTSQMRRSAISIPSNVAEGFVRRNMKEYRQFLHISLGSCAELETQLIISKKRNYLPIDAFEKLNENLLFEMRMLISLINKL
ncbi:MAG: four helix bundle protein [Candidatus Omnitrophota bacterium]|nr:four helix bundle protein [Candidatus Omnitrophota bacterium]